MITRRSAETAVALALGAIGGLMIAGAVAHDIGWGSLGPQPGYFPFRIGLLLLAVGLILLLQALRRGDAATFVGREEFGRVLTMFLPTAALAAAMPWLGCYVPTALYLGWMMRRHGRYGWGRTIVGSLAVTAAFYVVFDLWFLVPLAKGPVERAFGIY
jgi:hypothetical protein